MGKYNYVKIFLINDGFNFMLLKYENYWFFIDRVKCNKSKCFFILIFYMIMCFLFKFRGGLVFKCEFIFDFVMSLVKYFIILYL